MKKNIVITIVIAALLCIVQLGSTDAPRSIVSPVVSKYMNDPQSVTFVDEDSKTTVFIEKDGKFASLPDLPNDDDPNHEWKWIIDGSGETLTVETVINNTMTVHAVMTDNTPNTDIDFMSGKTGILSVFNPDYGNEQRAALIVDNGNLKACFEDEPCQPTTWKFELVEDPSNTSEASLYYVNSGSGYLQVSNSGVSVAPSAVNVLVKKKAEGIYQFWSPAQNADLSLKIEGSGEGTDSKPYIITKKYFKATTDSRYFENLGTMFSFYNGNGFDSDSYCTVTFNTKGGNRVAPQAMKVNKNETITLPAYSGTLSKHNFEGWSTDPNATGKEYDAGSPYIVKDNTTLYAVYDNTTQYIWLDGNGGTFEGDAFFEILNGSVELPIATGRDGYLFVGWEDQQGNIYPAGKNNLSDFNSDLTLHAVWHKVSQLTFVTNQDGQKPPVLIDIDEYPFVYLDQDNTYQVERNGVPETSDIGFYPPRGISKWMYFDDGGYKLEIDVSENPVFEVPSYDVTFFEVIAPDQEITVRFNPNGGEIEGSTGSYEYKAKNGEEIVLNTISVSRENENYKLIGWEDAFGYFYPASGLFLCRIDETLTAVWSYTVNFDARGGNGGSLSVNCILGQACTFPEYSGTRNGNAFLGWIMSETYNNGDTRYNKTDSLEENNEARAFRYYALYESTITFDTNGGGNLFDPAGNTVSKTLKNKQPWVDVIDLSQFTPVKNVEETSDSGNINNQIGKREFLGWAVSKNAGKDQIINAYEVTGALDQTLYAIWGSRFFYYMRGENGSEDIEVAPPSEPGLEGTPVTLTAAVKNLDAANFKGWTDGSKQYTLPDLNTKYRKTNTKLYALWDKDVQIVFNKNNQNNDVTGTAPASIPAKIGDEITIPGDNGLTKSGFDFLGWTDGSNLLDSSYHRIYKEGEKYVIPMTSGNKITFYAAWTPNGQADGVAKDQVRFGIRLDGTIPKEPGNYQASDYTSRKGIKLGNVFYSSNQVIERKWVADNDPNVSKLNTAEQGYGVAGYYIVNDVTKAVTMVPRAEDITFIMNNNGKDFDPSTQYVLWYVLKWQGKSGNDYIWHVDGVVLDKEKVTLVYDFNCDPVKKVNNMPRGFQVGKNTDIVVGDNGGINNHDIWMVPDRVDEAGIHFKGWSLVQDPGPEDRIFTAADPIEARTIKLTKPVTTLYAQWETSYVDVEFYKEWENDTDPLVRSLIPENIYLTLTGIRSEDKSVYKTHYFSVTPNGKDGNGKGWYLKVQNLPAFDTAGRALDWTWSERTVTHFKGSEPVPSSDGLVTTITNHLVTTSTVTKVWDDENDNDGKRPDSVTVQLYKYTDGGDSKISVGDPVPLTGDTNTWTYKAEDLPVFDGDKKITYTWDETDVPEGYKKTVGEPEFDPVKGWSNRITNQHDSETAPLKVVMKWDDIGAETPRPKSVTLTLTGTIPGTGGSGEVIVYGPETITVNAPVSGGSGYQWDEYTTGPLKVYKSGQKITYTWSEAIPDKYDHNAKDDVVTDSVDKTKTIITNHRYVITVTADDKEKVYGNPDPALTASAAITKQCPDDVCIVRNLGQASCSNGVCTVTVGSDTISFSLTRESGENVKPGGYTITGSGAEVQGKYSVIFIPGKLKITDKPSNALSVTKVWKDDDNRDGIRPVSLSVTLKGSDGSSRSVSLSEANHWSETISDLPQSVDGKPVTYTWSEEPVTGYSSKVEVKGDVTTFTNTHQIARTSRSVSKVWDDRDNAAGTRPSSLGVTLRNGSTTVFSTRLNEENGWHAVVSNLPVFENGRQIAYTWYEQAVGGGYRAVSSTTSSDGNTTLVNSNLYTVTIHYRYADGTRVFDSYTDRLPVGASFSVASPALRGYTPSQASVTGTMPAHDVEFIVIYTPEGQPVVTPTPVPTIHPEDPHKDVPHPRDLDPDADHPLVVPMPNMLVEIDDLNTALGLGEVVSSNHGFALE